MGRNLFDAVSALIAREVSSHIAKSESYRQLSTNPETVVLLHAKDRVVGSAAISFVQTVLETALTRRFPCDTQLSPKLDTRFAG
jgi:hypothetical protein